MKRHFDVLIIGTIQLKSDLDRFTCLPFIDWEIKCRRSRVNPTGFLYFVFKNEYLGESFGSQISRLPIHTIKIDGAEPIDDLKAPITILQPDYKGDRQENKVLDAIRSGIIWYNDMKKEVKFRDTSVLDVLKRLFLAEPAVITYGCWFKIYNSKSPSQM